MFFYSKWNIGFTNWNQSIFSEANHVRSSKIIFIPDTSKVSLSSSFLMRLCFPKQIYTLIVWVRCTSKALLNIRSYHEKHKFMAHFEYLKLLYSHESFSHVLISFYFFMWKIYIYKYISTSGVPDFVGFEWNLDFFNFSKD